MKSKYKMTGCARFFIVLIILAPLAYIGASYYNGQDGLQNLKSLFGIGEQRSKAPDKDLDDEVKALEDEIKSLQEALEDCQSKNGQ
jgi:hypothetical protein